MQISVEQSNARLDAMETTLGTAPKFQLFAGTMPANTAAADAGTKVVDSALPSDFMAAAASRSKAKSGTWSLTGIATGEARYYRVYNSAGTRCDWQGLVGQNWAASTVYPLNKHVINDGGKVYVCTTAGTSAGSGGPTGTGSGITDGTCVWNYVGVVDATMDNTSIANGQAATVTAFTINDGNT